MVYDYSKLKGRIKEKCGTQEDFAKKMKIGRTSLSQRLNNRIEFSQDEMFADCDVLNIEKTDIPQYFFCLKV